MRVHQAQDDRRSPGRAGAPTRLRLLPDIGGIYCLVVFLVLTAFAGRSALLDGDTLWHIKAGEIMLERGTILTTDIFSHTMHGQPWIAHEWLAEVIMALLDAWAGIPGVVIFYFFVTALTFWLLFQLAAPRDNPWLSVFCISPALVLAQMHMLARPHLFTWLFGVLTLLILNRGGRRLYLLPLLMVVWANLHGGFVLGLALQGLVLLGTALERGWRTFLPGQWGDFIREQRRPLLVLLLCVAAVGLNPFGYKLLLFPFQVSAPIFSTSVSEWLGTNMQENWPFRLFVLFVIFLLFFRGPQVSWTNRIFVLFFLNQAMLHSRHVSLAGIFLVPFLLESLQPAFDRLRDRWRPREEQPQIALSPVTAPALTVIVAVALMALGASGSPFWTTVYQGLFPLPGRYSAEAVAYVREHPPAGKMFNQDDLGDFLVYALGPDTPVFIDGRLDMYGERILKDYLKISRVSEATDALLASYGIGWVIYPNDRPLILYLREKPEWTEKYRDDQVSILVRKGVARP